MIGSKILKKKNPYFKILLILLSFITIISLFYFKLVYISSEDGINYYPFYKTMTYLDYAATTSPAFFELIAFLCITMMFIFLGISRFKEDDRLLIVALGAFQLVILAVLVTNIVVFKAIHQDVTIVPGATIFLLLLNSIVALTYGIPERKKVITEDMTNYVDPSKIRPISDIIRERREKAGLTQQQLADQVQVSRNTVYRWESGASNPNMYYSVRVAQVLHFPVSDFWGQDKSKMNTDIADVINSRQLYRQIAYFLLSLILVIIVIFSIAYLGRNMESATLDKVNPFIKQEVGYSLVQKSGKQKTAVVDNDYGQGNIITINGSYENKTEFVKIVHKGSFVKYEVRNIPQKEVPKRIRNNLYDVSHFKDPQTGLRKLQLSYTKRYI